MSSLKIGIISDLHCHPSSSEEDSTYLYTDSLRNPDHPIENLIETFKEQKLDLILCPGDFTNMSNLQGFVSGWNYVLELKEHFNANSIIATIGNHDVDSRNNYSHYSLEIPKSIKRNFPIERKDLRDQFWANGFTFLEEDNYRVLVVNSCHFHHNKSKSTSGEVDDNLIYEVEKYLKSQSNKKINIMLAHHHPIDHSYLKLGEGDKIINSEKLLDVLGRFGFDLIVHGHKHSPMLRYHNTISGKQLTIFSAGSFSAKSNILHTGIKNCFHILHINKNEVTNGTIETVTYLPQVGWKKNFEESSYMPPITGFGNSKNINDIVAEIEFFLKDKTHEKWEQVKQEIKEINNLIPQDALQIQKLLKEKKYALDEHISNYPTMIYNNDLLIKKRYE